MKPTKHFENGGKRVWKNGNIMKGGWIYSKYTVCMYGIITMKLPHIINICKF
jgi:hypothetical protein